jgi:methylthioribose-1-phosphate isomerase
MGLALRRIKVYCKLALMAAVAVVIFLVVVCNRQNEADVWFLTKFEKVNVLYLILVTAVSSVVLFWAITRIRGVIREARLVREERRNAEQAAQQKKLAEELADREKRIDEKLRRSIESEPKKG